MISESDVNRAEEMILQFLYRYRFIIRGPALRALAMHIAEMESHIYQRQRRTEGEK